MTQITAVFITVFLPLSIEMQKAPFRAIDGNDKQWSNQVHVSHSAKHWSVHICDPCTHYAAYQSWLYLEALLWKPTTATNAQSIANTEGIWVWLLLWSITESELSHFGHFLLSAWTWNHAIVKYEQTDDSIYSVSNKFGSKEFRRSRMDNQHTHNLNSQSPYLWQKHSKPFEQHSSTWWCTTISKLDVKVSAVQKIRETQPLLEDLNFQPWPWG